MRHASKYQNVIARALSLTKSELLLQGAAIPELLGVMHVMTGKCMLCVAANMAQLWPNLAAGLWLRSLKLNSSKQRLQCQSSKQGMNT